MHKMHVFTSEKKPTNLHRNNNKVFHRKVVFLSELVKKRKEIEAEW